MLPERDQVRLRHILIAAREAVAASEGRSSGELATDRPLMHTLVHCLEVVGEAASQLSATSRDRIPNVEWKRMVQMRNRLIHVYHDINLEIVWRTVTEDLPPLIAALEAVHGPEPS